MPRQVSAGVDVYQKVDVEQGTLRNGALVAMFPCESVRKAPERYASSLMRVGMHHM